MEDEAGFLVSYGLTHSLRGWLLFRRNQDGDGRQGSTVGTRPTTVVVVVVVVGRTWLSCSYHKLLRLPGGCWCFGLPVGPLGSWSYSAYV